jgi:hypothetical protein
MEAEMSKIALQGNVSGTGTISLVAPNTSTDRTLTLPDAAGTLDRLERAGNVLQVVSASDDSNSTTTSTSFVTTGFSLSITPTSSTSKILVLTTTNGYMPSSACNLRFTIYRNGSTNLGNANYGLGEIYSGTYMTGQVTASILDTPATTSAVSYTVYFLATGGATGYYNNNKTIPSSITLMEIAA